MSGYMSELRKIVGNRPLIQSGSAVIILDGAGRILLQQRKDNGKWGLPGGSSELGETVEQTAAREVMEETGLAVRELELFSVFSGDLLRYVYPNGDEVYNVAVVFTCRNKFRGEIKPDNEECTRIEFFETEALPDNLSSPCIPILEKFVGKPLNHR